MTPMKSEFTKSFLHSSPLLFKSNHTPAFHNWGWRRAKCHLSEDYPWYHRNTWVITSNEGKTVPFWSELSSHTCEGEVSSLLLGSTHRLTIKQLFIYLQYSHTASTPDIHYSNSILKGQIISSWSFK